jgi:hypothetical protein
MTRSIKFGDIFASKSGLKYVAVSSDAKSIWLFNEMRDLVIAQQTETGWQTSYVRNGSSGKVIYSAADNSYEESGKLTSDYQIRGPWVDQDAHDEIVILVREGIDKNSGYIQRYAALPAIEGFEIVTPDNFAKELGSSENYGEIRLTFPVNSGLQEFRLTSNFDKTKLLVSTASDLNFNSEKIVREEPPERMVPRDLTVTEAEVDQSEERPTTSIGSVGVIRRRDL